jgi:hypothetical protein
MIVKIIAAPYAITFINLLPDVCRCNVVVRFYVTESEPNE